MTDQRRIGRTSAAEMTQKCPPAFATQKVREYLPQTFPKVRVCGTIPISARPQTHSDMSRVRVRVRVSVTNPNPNPPPALMVAFWSHFCTSHLVATTYVISSQPHGLNFEISVKFLIQDCRETLGLPLELTPIILG